MRISDWSSDVCSSDLAAIARDRAEGYRLLMATAAPEFYAGAIAEALGFDAIVASRHRRDTGGNWPSLLEGPNFYRNAKAPRVGQGLATQPPGRTAPPPAFSDQLTSAPTFALAGTGRS